MNALLFATVVCVSQSFLPLSVDQLAHATRQVQRETDLLVVESMKELYRIGRQVPVARMGWLEVGKADAFVGTPHTPAETLITARMMLAHIEKGQIQQGRVDRSASELEVAKLKSALLLYQAESAERLRAEAELNGLQSKLDELEKKGKAGEPNDAERKELQTQIFEARLKLYQLRTGTPNGPSPLPVPRAGWTAESFKAVRAHGEMCAARDEVKRAIERLAKEPTAK